jgi:mannose-6-phosphate isomerase-like protein (cupin superfamily)
LSQRPIVSSNRSPAVVHGTTGTARWKCFARGSVLHSELEAWEYVALEPGAIKAEQLQTRTEKVCFFIGGQGLVSLDGVVTPLHAGDAVLMPLGCRHELRNTGEEMLEWIALEMTHPQTIERLPAWSTTGVVESE